MIVIEGPDSSGKSTLAEYLSSVFAIDIQSSEGPERYPGEINDRIAGYLELPDMIFDRHPCVSQPIYRQFNGTTMPAESLIKKFYEQKPIFVYCRGRDTPSGHIPKDHDSPEHIDMITKHHKVICNIYDGWALEHAHVIYRMDRDSMFHIARMVGGMR